ncbi:MAG: hypothetical protein IH836_04745 [Proteobacteria bacterium]|nr:hypothetical protein [Pseudomonadota bacterium]
MNDQQREMQRRLRVIKYVEKPGNQSWRQTTALIRRATTCRQLSTPFLSLLPFYLLLSVLSRRSLI